MKNYKKTNLKIEQVLVELQKWSKEKYWINKKQFKVLQIYEWQYFMKNNWTIWVLEWLREKIKIISGIKYIRIYF